MIRTLFLVFIFLQVLSTAHRFGDAAFIILLPITLKIFHFHPVNTGILALPCPIYLELATREVLLTISIIFLIDIDPRLLVVAMWVVMFMWPFWRVLVWLIFELNVLEDDRFSSSVVRGQFVFLLYNDYCLVLQP